MKTEDFIEIHYPMKLEYLHDLTANGKYAHVVSKSLIRLWDFDVKEAKQLQQLIREFAANQHQLKLALDEQAFITPINCKLTLIKDHNNDGIRQISPTEFICSIDNDGYNHIIHLIEPLTHEENNGHQWLDDFSKVAEDIDFLFSSDGSW